MRIELENLGVLKKAEFELGDLTLICGSNNTGKTYATYALFGFHIALGTIILKARVADSTIQELLRDGVTRLDVETYAEEVKHILKKGCEEYYAPVFRESSLRNPAVSTTRNSRFLLKPKRYRQSRIVLLSAQHDPPRTILFHYQRLVEKTKSWFLC